MLLPDERRFAARPRRAAMPQVAGIVSARDIAETAASIAAVQAADGSIPWFPGGHVDPWDHVECAMALAAAGRITAAEAAYDYLRRTQAPDGSWPSKIRDGVVESDVVETNQCAYVAVGVWHQLLITDDVDAAVAMWPTVSRAMDLVCSAALDSGAIGWAIDPGGRVSDEALLTGSSSMVQALRCGLALAERFGVAQPEWELVASHLKHAIAHHPEAFADKSRFAMDWYYPILGGALRGAAGQGRIARDWDTFVVPELGTRCVSDQPWVTGAETCELVLALDCLGERRLALDMFAAIQHLREGDGAYWTGRQFELDINWPDEHSTWTAAAVILAADALSDSTPAAGIFRGDDLPRLVDLDDLDGEACVSASCQAVR